MRNSCNIMGPRMGIKMGISNGKKIMGYDIGVNG